MNPVVVRSLQEYGRGLAGGLLFSLPMLYTMEVWWTGFLAGPARLAVLMAVTFVLLVGYNHYGGFRPGDRAPDVLLDSVVELGLGLALAAAVLWLLGQITVSDPWQEVLGKVVVAAMAVAIGISVGRAQLAGDDDRQQDREEHGQRHHHAPGGPGYFWGQLVMGGCGGVLIAANVAPTEEIVVIAVESSPWKLLALALISAAVGGAILFHTGFRGAPRHVRRPERALDLVTGIGVMYATALAVSAFMLWFFDRFDGVSPSTAAAQTVVLGLPATIGTSAGRLLIQH